MDACAMGVHCRAGPCTFTMALVDSLLTAIVRSDGDALVMHVGERPYVIASAGPIELSAHALNLGAMEGMLGQLLPADTLRALQEFGAIEHELSALPAMAGDRFTVVAARGGDDIWIEMRRHRRMKPARVVAPTAAPAAPGVAPPAAAMEPPAAVAQTPPPEAMPAPQMTASEGPSLAETVEALVSEAGVSLEADVKLVADAASEVDAPGYELTGSADETSVAEEMPVAVVEPEPAVVPVVEPEPVSATATEPEPEPVSAVAPEPEPASEPVPAYAAASALAPEAAGAEGPMPEHVDDARREDALPLSTVAPLRAVSRADGGPRLSPRAGGLERLLRLAAARGASALYLTSQSAPAIRVDGEVQRLAGEAALTSDDVEAAVLEILPEESSENVRRGETTEWICDLEEIGRLRCTTFRDHRGPGALVRMISARAASAEQLGLSREIQALATEPEGLVLVSGPRGSGKSTLVAAVVDLVNRQRADYVITLERQIRLVHEHRHSLISQREVRGHSDEVVAAARAALRENPDVLVIEDLRSPDVLQVALDAAGSGVLVVVSVTASATTAALERLVDMVPADRRKPVQALLAETLRGAVSQVLLRKTGGGRLAARELLLSTSAVARLVAEGQLAQLPRAIDSGRKYGMVPLNDALVAFVQSGAVDVREAYRKAGDRAGLLVQLKRDGIDTSFVERLA